MISNPGANPNLYPIHGRHVPPSETRPWQQSFDVNAMDPDFKWPQIWTTDIAIDQQLGGGLLGTLELIYGKDINSVFMRNADLGTPVRTLADGRPYLAGPGTPSSTPTAAAGSTSSTTQRRVQLQPHRAAPQRRSIAGAQQPPWPTATPGQEQPQVDRDRQRALVRASRCRAIPTTPS